MFMIFDIWEKIMYERLSDKSKKSLERDFFNSYSNTDSGGADCYEASCPYTS